ncbi:hypothetical protein AAFF_G00225310 [Aldrovandia affinis]|uniref:Uncharacterized protein n=1 Tax=Aldrovandia affinis TaxID=143900 RepID=A0AAD7X2E7_9TELE|nr:hypothetical protein AAFF_G00225310 [Aldrovandia affinis]
MGLERLTLEANRCWLWRSGKVEPLACFCPGTEGSVRNPPSPKNEKLSQDRLIMHVQPKPPHVSICCSSDLAAAVKHIANQMWRRVYPPPDAPVTRRRQAERRLWSARQAYFRSPRSEHSPLSWENLNEMPRPCLLHSNERLSTS